MSKRIPIYLSVEDMEIIRDGLVPINYATKDPKFSTKNRLDNLLEEEIERNTEPSGNEE